MEKTKQLNIRLDPRVYRAIEKAAKKAGMTISEFARCALARAAGLIEEGG